MAASKPLAFRKLARVNDQLVVQYYDANGNLIPADQYDNYDLSGTKANGDAGSGLPTNPQTPAVSDGGFAGTPNNGGSSGDKVYDEYGHGNSDWLAQTSGANGGGGLLSSLFGDQPDPAGAFAGKPAAGYSNKPPKGTTATTPNASAANPAMPQDANTPTMEAGAPPPDDIKNIITAAATKYGVDPDSLMAIAKIESNYDPNAHNPSGASGLFQFMPATARDYGLTNPNDPVAAADAAARLTRDDQKALTSALGRAPTTGELYLAHQQGITGATALLKNPDASALSVLTKVYGSADRAQAAITQNGGKANMTAGEFAGKWTNYADMTVQAIKTSTQTAEALPLTGKGAALPAPVPLGQKAAPVNTLAEIMGEFKAATGDKTPLTPVPATPAPTGNAVDYGRGDGVLGLDKQPDQFNTTSALAGNVAMPAGAKPASVTQMQADLGVNTPNFTMLGNTDWQKQLAQQFPSAPAPLNTTYNGNPAGIRVATVNPDGTDATLKSNSNDDSIKSAFLTEINRANGNPASTDLFGGQKVQNLTPDHPNTKVFYDDGTQYTTAAGAYQIPYPTWQQYAAKVGGADFSNPDDQKKVAWEVAADNYRTQTGGRDLLSDLKSGNTDAVASAFVNSNNLWSTLPGGKQPSVDINSLTQGFKSSVTAYTDPTDYYSTKVSGVPNTSTINNDSSVGAFANPSQKVTTSSGQSVTMAQKNAFAGTDNSKVNTQGSISTASPAVKSGVGTIAAGAATAAKDSSKTFNEGNSSPAPKSTGSVSNAGSVAQGAGSFGGSKPAASAPSQSSGTQKLQDIHDKLNK